MSLDCAPWSGLHLVEPVEEGNRNEVWRGELDGVAVSMRRSRRVGASLDWELDLLERLGGLDVHVPAVILTDEGRRHDGGVVVQRWIDGRAPSTDVDWALVATTLRRLHSIDPPPQRPECASVVELRRRSVSVDADLGALPDDVAAVVLGVFAEFLDAPISLVHGDPGPSNIRITDDGRVGLLDFDESRVDVSWHDLSNLGVQVLDDLTHARARRLSDAWEAVNAWVDEPDYAGRRFAALA